jgi:hypothetical protein
MSDEPRNRRMVLCAGLQSGGTTLVSWCFLQRQDTNGVLDMAHDMIQMSFEAVGEPVVWCKMTVASFRWLDVCETYRDLGWQPKPLLVVRDVRTAFSSLTRKPYGFNGITAEEPPLRMRFRRFLDDWRLFRNEGWPILRFEDLLEDKERSALQAVCTDLALPWDEGMISWPKTRADIAYFGRPNQTFESTIDRGSLLHAKILDNRATRVDGISRHDLDWLEDTFHTYNQAHRYPTCVTSGADAAVAADSVPRYGRAGKQGLHRTMKRLYAEVCQLRDENRRLRHGAVR